MAQMSPAVDPSALFLYLNERGISQTWLAARLGCSSQYLTEIKSGRKSVPAWMPGKVAEILAIPAFMLFDNLPETSDEPAETAAAS